MAGVPVDHLEVSTPTSPAGAPQRSAHASSAVGPLRHLEWFHDHVRIDRMRLDGVLEPVDGALHPDRDRPGRDLACTPDDAHLVTRSTRP